MSFARGALAAGPAALVLYLAYRNGGYFPDHQGVAIVVLGLALVARILLSERPFAGLSRWTAVACAALAAFAAWSLLSAAWSDAGGRALIEFQRGMLYLFALVLFASFPADARTLRHAVRWLALAFVLVAGGALISKLLPDLLPLSPAQPVTTRLSYPLEYWNALGLVCGLGALLLVHLTTQVEEHVAIRVASAAALPVVAAALLLTFSRGAMAVAVAGLLVYVALARPRGILGLLAAAGPAVFVMIRAYDAEDVADAPRPLPTALRDDAEGLALTIVLACIVAALLRLALVPLDARVRSWSPGRRVGRGAIVGLAVVALAGLATAVAADVPDRVERQWDRFLEDRKPDEDVQARLTDPSPSGRIEQWEAALDGFQQSPLKGVGAGTYEQLWYRARGSTGIVTDGHSLYLEQLGELGVVGAALLLAALLALVAGLVARVRGPDRCMTAALLACAVAWALHAGVDWDWEMPAVTIWLFALGGLALSRRPPARERAVPYGRRLVLALQVVAVLAVPGVVTLSETRLKEASNAFARGDCSAAVPAATDALDYLEIRAEVHELLGYCAVQQRRYEDAVAHMERATRLDPRTWDYQYGLALALASAGRDPRPAILRSAEMNPRDPLVRDAQILFATDRAATWRRWGRSLATRLREL